MALKLFYGTLTLVPHEAPELEGATFVEAVRTAPKYRLFSLDEFPALLEHERGVSIDGELWEVPDGRWQALLLDEPPGYYVAQIELDDGRLIDGMAPPAEAVAARGVDVSRFGSWKAYKAAS